MLVKQSQYFRIITMAAYNGCIPITVYIVQRREPRTFLPDKWVNIKGYEDREKAIKLYEALL